jgi:hypothetical protein
MTRIIDTTSKRHLSAKLVAGVAITAMLALGTFAGTATARDRDDGGRGGWEGGRGGGWGGGYYAAPAVVYGSSYGYGYYGAPYYAPPVVYAPEVGISVPGVSIGIR